MVGSRFLFAGLCLCICAMIALIAFYPEERIWMLGSVVLSVVFLFLLYRSVVKPRQTTMRGMELIASQDFNNRLSKVGETDSDKIVALFNSMIDKLRNERLKNIEQDGLLRLLIDASPMGVAMLDFNGRIDMVNRSFLKIMGISSESQIIGSEMTSLYSELASHMMEVPLGENRVIRGGDVRTYRCYHLSFIRAGFMRRFYLLESLTEEVMKAERAAYEKVIRVISHEVNNTMGGVRSVLQTLRDVCEDPDIEEVVDSCDDRCVQMCDFISSYADVVKVLAPVMTRVDINEKIRGLLPFLNGLAREGINVYFDSSPEPVDVCIDIALMQQVIVNIFKNAVESISEEGFVRIETLLDRQRPVMVISNNGKPMTEDVSKQLFSPFFTTKKEGRGIGLTLVSEILNRHGANYSLRTDKDGITRFRIEFDVRN